MTNKETLENYLNKQYILYSKSSFQFGKYYKFLYQLIHETDNTISAKTISDLNKFFVCANLLDDIMDRDNDELKYIVNLNREFSIYFKNLLSSIKKQLSKRQFSFFIDNISKSLIYQHIENKERICSQVTEGEYFFVYVKRSTFLLQAVVPIADEHITKSLYTSTKYLAYFGQIKNDIKNIRQPISSDLLDNRPTLPLIKAIECGNQENNSEIISIILSINKENYNQMDHEKVNQFISENNILQYCAQKALYFFNKAKEHLLFHFPHKENYINSFFTHLITKDYKND